MAFLRFYRSYSVYLIGSVIPDTNALATVAQWQFIELLLEVVQKTFVLAIFFFVDRGSACTKCLRRVDSKLHSVVSTASYVLFSSRIMPLMAGNVHFGVTVTDF